MLNIQRCVVFLQRFHVLIQSNTYGTKYMGKHRQSHVVLKFMDLYRLLKKEVNDKMYISRKYK